MQTESENVGKKKANNITSEHNETQTHVQRAYAVCTTYNMLLLSIVKDPSPPIASC
jgi:hypothetical protein